MRGVTEAKLKVAINGFGRIGRNFLRCGTVGKTPPWVSLPSTASHLLKYDSILGIFDAEVKTIGDNAISVDDKIIKGYGGGSSDRRNMSVCEQRRCIETHTCGC